MAARGLFFFRAKSHVSAPFGIFQKGRVNCYNAEIGKIDSFVFEKMNDRKLEEYQYVPNDVLIEMLLKGNCGLSENMLLHRNHYELMLMAYVMRLEIPLNCWAHLTEQDYKKLGDRFGLSVDTTTIRSHDVCPNISYIRGVIEFGSKYVSTLYAVHKDQNTAQLLRILPGFNANLIVKDFDPKVYDVLVQAVRHYISYLNFRGGVYTNI